ncbi:hypothetical protein PN441_19505 [Spirulina major CS-329]|uniref:hypothetical protein n=1 Tax=Spirulina TaxID=1154 RepID=UPI00232F0A7B|nr:hypothetical protein [Spirulina subsalsa]MDB9505271.1 hypothetical protein [Spirulina major CS-329]
MVDEREYAGPSGKGKSPLGLPKMIAYAQPDILTMKHCGDRLTFKQLREQAKLSQDGLVQRQCQELGCL